MTSHSSFNSNSVAAVSKTIEESGVSEDGKLKIISVSWKNLDLIDEFENILQDSTAENVKKQFNKYVTENIEPVGWQAVWRPREQTTSLIEKIVKKQVDYLVEVLDISEENLKATVAVRKCIKDEKCFPCEDDFGEKEYCVSLIELFPLAFQENQVLDIETTAEVIEQIRFFFENIWLPWDSFEELCIYDKHLLTSRMKIYEEMTRGVIPYPVAREMKALRSRAQEIAQSIFDLEAKTGIALEVEVDERDLVQLVKLNKEMEQLKNRFEYLSDPALRELMVHQEQLQRKEILVSVQNEEPANVLIVGASVQTAEFVQSISLLPKILDSFPQTKDVSRVQTFQSLQMALDAAVVGDIIILISGSHLLKELGAIARGGIMCGVGENVEICGSISTGDVLMDVKVDDGQYFMLQSVNLRPLKEQTGVLLHKGRMVIKDCVLRGGSVGISILQGSESRLEASRIIEVETYGIECKSGSQLYMSQLSIENCHNSALMLEDGSKVSVIDEDNYIRNCRIGVEFSWFSENDSNDSSSNFHKNLMDTILQGCHLIKFEDTSEKYSYRNK